MPGDHIQVHYEDHGSGTGEVLRYLRTYAERRVRAAALLAPMPPFLPPSAPSQHGAGLSVLDEVLGQLSTDVSRMAAGL